MLFRDRKAAFVPLEQANATVGYEAIASHLKAYSARKGICLSTRKPGMTCGSLSPLFGQVLDVGYGCEGCMPRRLLNALVMPPSPFLNVPMRVRIHSSLSSEKQVILHAFITGVHGDSRGCARTKLHSHPYEYAATCLCSRPRSLRTANS